MERIHQLFDAGISKSGIARRLGMSRTTVTRLLTLPAPPRRKENCAASRRASGSARRSGRPITVLPPVTRPAPPEQRAQIVRTLLLTHGACRNGRQGDQNLHGPGDPALGGAVTDLLHVL